MTTNVRQRRRDGSTSPAGSPADLADAFPEPPPAIPPHAAMRSVPTDGPIQPSASSPSPSQRLQSVENTSEGYAREYRLKLLHRFLLRNLPLDVIATSMSMTIGQITNMRRELFRRLKHEAGNVDMLTHAGRTLSFYDEIRGQALKMASDGNKTDSARLKALATSLAAEKDKHWFLREAGFYDQIKYLPKSGAADDTADQAMTLGDIAKSLLDPDADMSALADLARLDRSEDVEQAMFGDAADDDLVTLI